MVEINTPWLNYIALWIPILPLIGFLVNGLLGQYLPKTLTGWLGSLVVLGSFVCSVILFMQIDANEALRLDLFSWIAFDSLENAYSFALESCLASCMSRKAARARSRAGACSTRGGG